MIPDFSEITLWGYFRRMTRQDCPEDPKYLGVLMAGATLCLCLIILVLRIALGSPKDAGVLVGLALSIATILGTMVVITQRVPDDMSEGAPAAPPDRIGGTGD